MKGTVVDGTVGKLFEGKIKNYISCINVQYESSRIESFYDLSVNVKGCKDLLEAFDKYVEEEKMEGDNKYMTRGYGLQDANKGCAFMKFPPVLHLQLKRFEYDPMRDAMVKVNDRFEFPSELNLDKYLHKDVADPNDPHTFILHSVLVHSGDVHGGHYYAFVRPYSADGQFFKFDDERVTKASEEQAITDNFGGDDELPQHFYKTPGRNLHKRFSNAYMLVYVREKEMARLLGGVGNEDIPESLRDLFDREQAAAEARRTAEAEAEAKRRAQAVASLRAALAEPPDNNFIWRLGGFTTLREPKVYSDTFTVGGVNWRISCFPRGNKVDDLSLYLDVADSKQLPVCHLSGSA